MDKDFQEMWYELREYVKRGQSELYDISQKYNNNIEEKKRVEGKSDG